MSSKFDISDVIPANERQRKKRQASTRPNDPTVENNTGILGRTNEIMNTHVVICVKDSR